ncbi:MAG: alpha/beta hydrolase [Akkermansiaceae bacterium]
MKQTIKNSQGETLDYTFTQGNEKCRDANWLVILGHGVTGDKDRPVITDTAKALCDVGFDTLAFSYAGNGASEGDFRAATISKEVEDLGAIIDAVSDAYAKIAYIGHSMGGAVGLSRAAQDARISALVSIAGMIDTKAFAVTEFGDETPDAGLMWEEESCPLSSAFMYDLCDDIVSLEPLVKSVTIPWLLMHGTADDVVLPKDTECVQALRGEAVDAVFVEGADHSFNEPIHKAQLCEKVGHWLRAQRA